MKKLILSAALLSSAIAFSQQKQDSTKVKSIEGVTMTKKVFQKKADRMVYDVAASPSTKGSTAFDLLKETPTVTNTDDKEFKILGKSAVAIYINGRKSNMNSDALLALLKSTPSENISKVEVISVPGSEYDVSGNTGIINIVMKKRNDNGLNGTLRMENEKSYYDSPSSGLSLNFRKNKIGGNFNAGYSESTHREEMILENGDATHKTVSNGYIKFPNKDFTLGGTLDYTPNDKNYFSWSINTVFDRSNNNDVHMFNTNFEKNVLTDSSLMLASGNDRSKNISTELHYDRNQDERGSKLKLNAGYLYYQKTENTYNRSYKAPSMVLSSGFNQTTPQNIHNYSFQADEILKLKDESMVSFGGNFNTTKTDNNTLFEAGDGYTFTKSDDLSNHFVYNETIGALYGNYEKNFSKKFMAKVGLRYEMTFTKGDILGKDDPFYHFTKNYQNFLPFLSMNYSINDNNSLSYNFSSRVRRPSFWELNPVRNYTTKTNYIQNNPFMIPSKIYGGELTYMYKNAYFLTLGHSYTQDASTQIPLQKPVGEAVLLRYIRTNYGSNRDLSATVGMQKSFYKGFWVANYTATFTNTIFKGSVDTDPLTHEVFKPYIVDRKSNYVVISANNQVALDKKKTWWLGVDYFCVTPQKIELGNLSLIQQLNLSVKKNWENWTFKAAVDDIFNLDNHINILNTNSNGYFNNVYQTHFNRAYTVSISYNFGNQKVKGARQEDSANKDIKSRTGK